MLTSSNQYLRPDYLSPLPTTLDAKKSPLALLAQTCSAIGADGPNPKLVSAAEKGTSKSSPPKPAEVREKSPPAPVDNKPSFKPYESCLTRDKSASPESRASAGSRSPPPAARNKSGAATPATPAQRCASSHSSTSQRGTPPVQAAPRRSPAAASPRTDKEATPVFKPFAPEPIISSGMFAAQQHALKGALHPYLAYARLKAAGECRDPYCAGCSLSAHLMKSCGAGCVQCDHAKALGGAYAAHAQLAALAAAQLPYVCSWVGGDAAYCGKRFAGPEELLAHLRSHAAGAELARSVSGSLGVSPRFHPYGSGPKPPLFPMSGPPLYFPPYPLFAPRPLPP